jgi:hypothetical protein
MIKLQVDKIDNKFTLDLNGERVFEADKLSEIVRKIEAHLKLRYLPEPTKIGIMERITGVVNGK